MEERGISGTINLSIIKDENNLTGQVHHLPCCIKFNGPASVSHYFKPRSAGFESDGLEVEEAYFRGRKLRGAMVSLPNGYSEHLQELLSTHHLGAEYLHELLSQSFMAVSPQALS